jgi:hypothetical protein
MKSAIEGPDKAMDSAQNAALAQTSEAIALRFDIEM